MNIAEFNDLLSQYATAHFNMGSYPPCETDDDVKQYDAMCMGAGVIEQKIKNMLDQTVSSLGDDDHDGTAHWLREELRMAKRRVDTLYHFTEIQAEVIRKLRSELDLAVSETKAAHCDAEGTCSYTPEEQKVIDDLPDIGEAVVEFANGVGPWRGPWAKVFDCGQRLYCYTQDESSVLAIVHVDADRSFGLRLGVGEDRPAVGFSGNPQTIADALRKLWELQCHEQVNK